MSKSLIFEAAPFEISTHGQAGAICECPGCRAARQTFEDEIFEDEFGTPPTLGQDAEMWWEAGESSEESDPSVVPVPTPGSLYAIQYGKGGLLTTTARAYGVGSGTERLQLAQQINRHSLNRKFWVPPANEFERRYFPQGIISFNPRFTCESVQRPATGRERKCFARIWIPPKLAPKPVPPDRGTCSVPRNVARREIDLEFAREEVEQPRPVTVRPRVSLFQNASVSSERNHFECGALRWAAKSGSIKNPSPANCARRVGATSYDSGADIIRTIGAAHSCMERPVETMHIFSHAGDSGVFGTDPDHTIGLYHGTLDADSQSRGGRLVADVPTTSLSGDVIFVLHGCNTAAGDSNFARALYEHLAGSLRNPRVFGHPNSGCASRDNSWREYSNRSPAGRRRLRSLSPHYTHGRCCGEA